jgi:glycosyltransferase involved in cell wall biosynthesis
LLGVIRGERCWQPDPDPATADLVSVIVTCYNQARFLRHSLESVLGQTYGRFEIVLIDDGSTDNTAAIARRYPGVRYVHQENKGLAAARNAGLRCSEGEFINFLDADDRLLPDALQKGIAALRAHPECPLVWGSHRYIDLDGSFLRDSATPVVQEDLFCALLERNVIGMHATVMYRRALFDSVGVFDESLRAVEDHELLLRISRRFPLHRHGAMVAEYRDLHGTTLSRDPQLMLASSMSVLRSQRPHAKTREAKHSLRVGKRHLHAIHGERLVAATILAARQRRYRLVLQSVCVLLRYHPAGVARLLFRWIRTAKASGRVSTARG